MTQNELQTIAETYWREYRKVYPKLASYSCPCVLWNNRFTKTGGVNRSEKNVVELAAKFYAKYPQEILRVTLPHELAHQIDYNLHGWTKGHRHHRNSWKIIMVKIGQTPEVYHNMVL